MTITIPDTDLDCLRAMIHEQIGADTELLRELDAGLAGKDTPAGTDARITLCESIASQIGGLMTDDMLSQWLTDGTESA